MNLKQHKHQPFMWSSIFNLLAKHRALQVRGSGDGFFALKPRFEWTRFPWVTSLPSSARAAASSAFVALAKERPSSGQQTDIKIISKKSKTRKGNFKAKIIKV